MNGIRLILSLIILVFDLLESKLSKPNINIILLFQKKAAREPSHEDSRTAWSCFGHGMRVSGLAVRKIAFQMLIFTAVGFLRPFGSKPAEPERQILPSGAPKLRSISAFSCIAVITYLFYSAAKIRLSEQKTKFYVSFFVFLPHPDTKKRKSR
jgi:hypothetical protein